MTELPAPLAGLAVYQQFNLWKPVPRDNGKIDKVPCNHLRQEVNAHDTRYHMTFETAAHYSAANGLGVGFVLTEQDDIFCVDIDGCADSSTANGWSETANMILALFPGAAVEISQSGNSLHVFGRGQAPPHGKRNKELHAELYTEKRFIALTGTNAIGNVNTEHTAALAQFAPYYFPPTPDYDAADWTTEADPESKPIEDDKALIKKALSSMSVATQMGVGETPTFKQLYENDEDALAEFYTPDNSNTYDTYDRNYADLALCQHLAFWTGGNSERIEKLFNESALVRGKWLDREDYRRSRNKQICPENGEQLLNALQKYFHICSI